MPHLTVDNEWTSAPRVVSVCISTWIDAFRSKVEELGPLTPDPGSVFARTRTHYDFTLWKDCRLPACAVGRLTAQDLRSRHCKSQLRREVRLTEDQNNHCWPAGREHRSLQGRTLVQRFPLEPGTLQPEQCPALVAPIASR